MSKRILSLVLAMVMVLGTFGTVFAADVIDTAAKAGAFLKEAGVLVGDEHGNLNLDSNLSRQDAVILVAQLRGEIEAAKNFSKLPTYEDVKIKFYNAPLAWAQDNGLFVGHSEKVFGFGENLTAQEYAKVLLSALGYKVAPNGDSDIKWAEALAKAEEFGILENLEVINSTEITRGQMALMTFNALGVTMKDSKETLADTLGIKLPEAPKAEELTAKVLDTENLAEIVVELSNADLVKNKEALTNAANYRLNNDVTVYNAEVDGDNVILTLVPYGKVENSSKFNTLLKGKKYELTIRNIDPKINKTYKGILAGDNAIPTVENVEFMGTYGIKVTTSEPIANPLERNFRLDSRTSMVVEQYGRELILTPYHGKAFDKDAVELTVDQLEDFAGYRSAKTVEKMELSTDEALPKVEEAYRSGSKLVVVFDRDVYIDSIGHYESRRDLGNVSFVERRVTFYAEDSKKVDTNVVEYTFSRDIPKNIEVEIEGVANHFNKAMEKETIVPVEYKDDYAPIVIESTEKVKITQKYEDELKPLDAKGREKELKNKLDDGFAVETQEMTIKFDKDIAEFKNLKAADINVKDHFTLYELDITRKGETAAKDVEINVTEVKKDSIKLSFEGIKLNNKDRDFDYILEVRNFSDLNKNRMEREYLDFQVIRIKDAFDVTKISVNNTRYSNRNGVEIVLEFNDYVEKEEASNAKNYYLDGKLKVSEAIVEKDGKTVSLVVYDTDVTKLLKDYKVLEISPRVTKLDDSAVTVDHRFWDLKTRTFIANPEGTTGSAITFKADGTPLTADEVKEYKTLEATTGSAIVMTVDYKGTANNLVVATLVDANGRIVNNERQSDVSDVDGIAQVRINVPVDKAATYTLKVTADGEAYDLPIKVQGTRTDIVVKYNGTDVTANATSPAGHPLQANEKFLERNLDIKLADDVVAEIRVVKITNGQYNVIVTPESGAVVVHEVRIIEQ